jgi:hypothetical protein
MLRRKNEREKEKNNNTGSKLDDEGVGPLLGKKEESTWVTKLLRK